MCNIVKHEKVKSVVIFNEQYRQGRPSSTQVYCDGTALQVSPSFVYLGMDFEAQHGMRGSWRRSFDKGRKAYFAMIRRCNEMGIHNILIRSHLLIAWSGLF